MPICCVNLGQSKKVKVRVALHPSPAARPAAVPTDRMHVRAMNGRLAEVERLHDRGEAAHHAEDVDVPVVEALVEEGDAVVPVRRVDQRARDGLLHVRSGFSGLSGFSGFSGFRARWSGRRRHVRKGGHDGVAYDRARSRRVPCSHGSGRGRLVGRLGVSNDTGLLFQLEGGDLVDGLVQRSRSSLGRHGRERLGRRVDGGLLC